MFADHCSLVWCNKEQIAGHDLVEVFLLIPELYFSITCIAQQPCLYSELPHSASVRPLTPACA